MALAISLAQYLLRTHKMVVRKMIAAEVVEICNALPSRVFCERRRGLVNIGKNLLGTAQVADVKEQFEANVGA